VLHVVPFVYCIELVFYGSDQLCILGLLEELVVWYHIIVPKTCDDRGVSIVN
jgi:hypothetical protein